MTSSDMPTETTPTTTTAASHHRLGTGPYSQALAAAIQDPEVLLERVSEMVEEAGLGVVVSHRVGFEGGGHTLVWILSESHLVLHHWHREGFATLDLHVCDYRESNAAKANALQQALDAFIFQTGHSTWRQIELPRPQV